MDPRQRNILSLVFIAILVIGSWALFWPPKTKITQGLDLQGGLSVILTAQPTASSPITNEAMGGRPRSCRTASTSSGLPRRRCSVRATTRS